MIPTAIVSAGWTPIIAVIADGDRRILKIVDWLGGDGPKPRFDVYVGSMGLTTVKADAVDIRGHLDPTPVDVSHKLDTDMSNLDQNATAQERAAARAWLQIVNADQTARDAAAANARAITALDDRLTDDEDDLSTRTHIEILNGPPTAQTPGDSPNDFGLDPRSGVLYQYSALTSSYHEIAHFALDGEFDQRVLVDVPASAETRDKLIVENSQLYTTKDVIVHQATPKRATYVNQRFDLGYFGDESALDPNFYVVGRYYYNFTKHTPRVVAYIQGNAGAKHWVDANAADLVAEITGDVGHYASDAEATPHINAVGNVYYNERSRIYRRADTFAAGVGPVRGQQRLRQANEDDLARIDGDLAAAGRNEIDFVIATAPTSVELSNFPSAIQVIINVKAGKFAGTSMRLQIFGQQIDIAAGNGEDQYNPDRKRYRISVPTTPRMLANARAALVGPEAVPYYGVAASILGGETGNVELASSVSRIAINPSTVITDLQHRTSDLRVVAPPGWETAVGTGVGISLTTALVADPTALSFNPSVAIPADAEVGSPLIIYMSIPTGQNLSDWRIDLAGFAYYTGFTFGEVAVDGDNTVYAFTSAVGNDTGGFSSGTAAGAELTLQHHGTDPHTAYSGDLEGRALAQVRALASTSSDPLSGLTQAQVDERVRVGTLPQARAGNIAAWPPAKLGSGTRDGSKFLRDDGTWQAVVAAIQQATTTRLGGVLAIMQSIVDAGTSTGAFAWDMPNLRRFIRTLIPTWAERDDVSTIPPSKLGGGTHDASTVLHGDGTFRTATGEAFALSKKEEIGLLKFSSSPPSVQFAHIDELTHTFVLAIDNPELLTGDVWYQRKLNEANIGNRIKWTDTTFSIDFPTPNNAQTRVQMAASFRAGGSAMELEFWDAAVGGNGLGRIRSYIGGTQALLPTQLANRAQYDNIVTKLNNRLYHWPDQPLETPPVKGGAAIGDRVIGEGNILTQAQTELLLARAPTAVYALPDAGAITWDLDSGHIAQITLGGAPRNFQALVNARIGDELLLRVVQDATGGRAITWHRNFEFPLGALSLNDAANAVTYLKMFVFAANRVLVMPVQPPAATAASGGGVGDAVFSGNVGPATQQFVFNTVGRNQFWPDDAEYLIVSLNPSGRTVRHTEEGHIIRNPKKGRYLGDTTAVTARANGESITQDDYGVGIQIIERVSNTQASVVEVIFGRTNAGEITVGFANGTPTLQPLVIRKFS